MLFDPVFEATPDPVDQQRGHTGPLIEVTGPSAAHVDLLCPGRPKALGRRGLRSHQALTSAPPSAARTDILK